MKQIKSMDFISNKNNVFLIKFVSRTVAVNHNRKWIKQMEYHDNVRINIFETFIIQIYALLLSMFLRNYYR